MFVSIASRQTMLLTRSTALVSLPAPATPHDCEVTRETCLALHPFSRSLWDCARVCRASPGCRHAAHSAGLCYLLSRCRQQPRYNQEQYYSLEPLEILWPDIFPFVGVFCDPLRSRLRVSSCPLLPHNLLAVKLFIPSAEQCGNLCHAAPQCRC